MLEVPTISHEATIKYLEDLEFLRVELPLPKKGLSNLIYVLPQMARVVHEDARIKVRPNIAILERVTGMRFRVPEHPIGELMHLGMVTYFTLLKDGRKFSLGGTNLVQAKCKFVYPSFCFTGPEELCQKHFPYGFRNEIAELGTTTQDLAEEVRRNRRLRRTSWF